MKKTITILLSIIASISLGLMIDLLSDFNWFISALIIFIILLSHSLLFGITERFSGGAIHQEQETDAEKNEYKKAIATQILLIIIALIGIIIAIFPFDH